jgi:membrane protein DedA with SNARE-associated domain
MTGLIMRFGVLGVFLLMVPESACIPVPSEVTLLFSGFAVHQGWMSLPLAVLAATAGNLVGSLLAYGVGATHVLQRLPVASEVLRRWDGLLERHGTEAVFIARLLPLARTFVSLPAGARHIPLAPFIALTTSDAPSGRSPSCLPGCSPPTRGRQWIPSQGADYSQSAS